MGSTVTLFLFARGAAESQVENMVVQAQWAAALDTLDHLRALPEIGEMVVATADKAFAARAAALGARIEMDPPQRVFHFGDRLAELVARYRASVPLYIGGGSGVLMDKAAWRDLAGRVLQERQVVITNNFYSCDFAAWSPGDALARVDPPVVDNDLAFRLGERAGLRVIPLAKNAATQLDLDTPTDLLAVSLHPACGAALRAYMARAALDTARIEPFRGLLQDRRATVLIAGRVSASMALFLERETRCQWRILSEERGMRASGRLARGEVRALLGFFLEGVGASAFFARLADLADAAIIDSRVLFAHRGLLPTAADRFSSDLLAPESIADPFVRTFTAAARAAPLPVLLGGHSLVSGGMYALVEGLGKGTPGAFLLPADAAVDKPNAGYGIMTGESPSTSKEKAREMPKSRPAARSTKKPAPHKTPRAKKKTAQRKTSAPRETAAPRTVSAPQQNYTEEYTDYLERYELYGEGRPRLSPAEFERLDEELLDLLALESEQGVLNDDQIVRLQELEFLLLDSEQ